MTEPSQYFKGRTIQEQMDEVIGYVDKRAEEVAAAKADDVLQPAEDAKTAAQAAAEAAEAAKNATIAALPDIRQDISGLKAEDAALDGRLNTVELKIQTVEGNIVTIQGQIVALQNVQGDYVKKAGAAQTVTSQIMVPTTATGLRDTQIANGSRIQNDLHAYEAMIRTTGNQSKMGIFTVPEIRQRSYYSTKHVVQIDDAPAGTYYRIYTTKMASSTDRNGLIMWNNTRKGLPAQNLECGIISIGARPASVQIGSIAGTVPSRHFAITRKVNGDNDVDVTFWSTGQIKVFDILFESIGYNNMDVWTVGDLAAVTDFGGFDEVVYL